MKLNDVAVLVRQYVLSRWRFRRLRGDALRRHQERAARAAFQWALDHSPFWRRQAQGLSAGQWRQWPVVDKAAVMAEFADVNVVGITKEEALAVALKSEETRDFSPKVRGHTVVLSSGTSGHRGISLVSDEESAAFAGFALARVLDGISLTKRHRVAFFLRSNSNMNDALRSPWIDFRYFDLTLSRAQIAERLNALQPDILLGPPALLQIVADLVDDGALAIAPQFVLSGAEVLEPQVRARLEALFGVLVRDIYHTSEGPIALSCREGRLHIQEDAVIVELEPVAEGRFTPIVSQVFRRTLPLLRYRMNDVVVLDDVPCPCGSAFRVIAAVEGRCDDVFYVPRRDGSLKGVFPDQLRRAALETDGVREYRVTQESPTHIVVHVDGATDGLAGRVTRLLGDDVDGVVVDVVAGVADDADQRKKRVRVRRTFALTAAQRAAIR